MKSICIIELDFHPECIYGLAAIFDKCPSYANYIVHFITRHEIYDIIKDAVPIKEEHIWNDERAFIKKVINTIYNSEIVEEKQFIGYNI
jgi:hypothetical protein